MDKIDYLSCRCNIDFAENKDINFLSFNYDEELLISSKDKKVKLKDTAIDQYNLTLVGDVKKAKLVILFPEVITLFVINVLLSFLQTAFTFKGLLSFGADYLKYMLFQMTFLSTMIATFYNLFWAIFSGRKQLDYYGRINSTINSFRPQKCSFENAKSSVLSILDNTFIYGDNECFKRLPHKKKYLESLRQFVSHSKKVSQYEYEYSKALSSISNRGSLLITVIGVILSALIQAFAFLDTWSSVSDEFHLNMIASTVLLIVVIPLIMFCFIYEYYYKRIMELESLYCLYSYQYLEMPYTEKTCSYTFDFSKYKESSTSFYEDFPFNFIKTFNESIFYKISIRDIKLDDGCIISVLGLAANELNSKTFKQAVASIYERFDVLYLSQPQRSVVDNQPRLF